MIIPNRGIIRLTKPKFIHVWEYKLKCYNKVVTEVANKI